MKATKKQLVGVRLDDAARYAKQARKALQLVDKASFEASLRGARYMLDEAERHFTEGMEE